MIFYLHSYDENYDQYFKWNVLNSHNTTKQSESSFSLSIQKLNHLNKNLKNKGFHVDALELLNFIKEAIEAREYSKFLFTRNISMVLKRIKQYAKSLDISLEDISFSNIQTIMALNSSIHDEKTTLLKSIKLAKEQYKWTKSIFLPPLIVQPNNVFYFYEDQAVPNFITQKNVLGDVYVLAQKLKGIMEGKVIFIENADPGYDWIFSHSILGLVTKFGGANSHMAIRCAEQNIPAVIGAGSLYEQWKESSWIRLDCMNQKVDYDLLRYE